MPTFGLRERKINTLHAFWRRVAEVGLTDAEGNSILTLKPDAVIRKLDDRPVILDTKWKRLTPGKKRLGVADSDVYQMLAYARAYNAKGGDMN